MKVRRAWLAVLCTAVLIVGSALPGFAAPAPPDRLPAAAGSPFLTASFGEAIPESEWEELDGNFLYVFTGAAAGFIGGGLSYMVANVGLSSYSLSGWARSSIVGAAGGAAAAAALNPAAGAVAGGIAAGLYDRYWP